MACGTGLKRKRQPFSCQLSPLAALDEREHTMKGLDALKILVALVISVMITLTTVFIVTTIIHAMRVANGDLLCDPKTQTINQKSSIILNAQPTSPKP